MAVELISIKGQGFGLTQGDFIVVFMSRGNYCWMRLLPCSYKNLFYFEFGFIFSSLEAYSCVQGSLLAVIRGPYAVRHPTGVNCQSQNPGTISLA